MEISEIKARLTLAEVLQHYGHQADKNDRMHCPFHEDKTPSMQVYYKTNTAYCFSSNCSTHGKSLDVIDFVMHKEKVSKHEAIKRCETLLNGNTPITPLSRTAVLTRLFTYFKNALPSSPPAKEYLQSRNLDYKKIEVGYNAGQFHHGTRKEEQLIKSCLAHGLLIDKNLRSRTGEKAYQPFGKWCLCFALRNQTNQITGLYFRSTLNNDNAKHYYLKDRQGLYPGYPKSETKRLILTEAIIDAASLLQEESITSEYSILALYGTNSLTEAHLKAVKALKELEEMIFFFDGDKAGKEAIHKYGKALQALRPEVKISQVNTPEGEDINSLLQGHSPEILEHLIKERLLPSKAEETDLIFSLPAGQAGNETPVENKKDQTETITLEREETKDNYLNTDNPNNIYFAGSAANYTIKGGLKLQLDSLKVSLQIIQKESRQDYRSKIDLYDYKQIQQTAETVSELLTLRKDQIEQDLQLLSHLLENYREEQLQSGPERKPNKIRIKVPEATAAECISFMKQKDLLKRYNTLIGKSGVTGEEVNRIFLFVIASSYKMKETLHGLIQGSSGSGKTRLLKIISSLMPPEDIKRFTRVTDSSFYNYGEYDLVNMLLCFEDVDGMKEDAQLALRELQSNDILISSTSQKDESGNIRSAERIVRGPIASLSATTKGDYYEDNISRCFVIAVDESKEQTLKIIKYQNEVAAGVIDKEEEKKAIAFVQNCIRLLKPYEVVNQYANKIQLPEDAHKIRRLNEMYQSIVKQVTLLNQYQRKQDAQGRLITEKEDLQTACEILFESILLKVDELDGSLRQFYEKLKGFVTKQGKDYEFNRFEVRAATGVSKTQQHRYLQQLLNLEYVKQFGFANRGFRYKIAHWDNMTAVRAKIKENLAMQLQSL
ncbi:MAG TPA: CHC2 zinc finger domain-containing protein [Cytophagaceae bacterium]|jgi:DNA primase/energy-coupling factor transporter ATP-binding protein EcfA2